MARQVVATTDLTNPDDIADAVYERTPEDAIHDAYRLILRNTAREAIHQTNMSASAVPAPQSEPRRQPNKSSKVAAIKDSHTNYYDQRVFANGDWKLLRHCTREDVLDLAAHRQAIADRNTAKAAEFHAIHDRMVRAGVEFAGDLEQEAAA